MIKRIILVGAGHAHLTILKNLKVFLNQGHSVTVINAEKYHYYSGMGPGMLSGTYAPEEIRFHAQKMVTDQGGRFIRDEFVRINPIKQTIQTKSGKNISYDAVCFNIGSYVPFPNMTANLKDESFVFPVKPIANLLSAKKQIQGLLKHKKASVLVIGGGPSGVEIAANLCAFAKKLKKAVDVTLVSERILLNRFDKSFRAKARTILKQYGVNLLEHRRVERILNHCIKLKTGQLIACDIVFWAAGILPPPFFKSSGLPTGPDGGLLVNKYLQCVSYPNIFAGGDCISFQKQNLNKVGVYAVRQNPVLFKNLNNFLNKKPLKAFVPQKDYLIILNMGNGQGLLKWKNFTHRGKAAFWLKNYIDQKFMKKFQISKERTSR